MANASHLYNKDGKPFYKFEYYRGKDKKRLYLNWQIPEGMSFATPRGAERIEKAKNKALAKFELDCEKGIIKTTTEKTEIQNAVQQANEKLIGVQAYCETRFLPHKKKGVKISTYEDYERLCRTYIYPAIGHFLLGEVTKEMLSDIVNKIVDEGKSYSVAQRVYVTLNLIFELAYIEDEIIDKNPMDKVKRPKNKELQKGKKESLSLEQLQIVLNSLEDVPLKWKTITYMLAFSGVREGELAALTWDCVNFREGYIRINKSIVRYKGGITTDTPKSGRERIVFIDPLAMDVLKEWYLVYGNASEYVFPNRDDLNSPIRPDSITSFFTQFAKKKGFDFRYHAHGLRHTYASLRLAAGQDIATISDQLGHADINTTLKFYVHAQEENSRKAAGLIGQLLESAKKSQLFLSANLSASERNFGLYQRLTAYLKVLQPKSPKAFVFNGLQE